MSSAQERFWAKVHKTDSCWLWTGVLTANPSGYGQFRSKGRSVLAHRWAYEQFVAPIPGGMEIDHLCRVHRCVNPTHLEAVTHQENMSRGEFSMKTHCPKGHPYGGRNLYVGPDGKRRCNECRRVRQRLADMRQRALPGGKTNEL